MYLDDLFEMNNIHDKKQVIQQTFGIIMLTTVIKCTRSKRINLLPRLEVTHTIQNKIFNCLILFLEIDIQSYFQNSRDVIIFKILFKSHIGIFVISLVVYRILHT